MPRAPLTRCDQTEAWPYSATLAKIPDGESKTRSIAVGRLRIAGEQASVAAFAQWFKGA
jgi:hypothetical protein